MPRNTKRGGNPKKMQKHPDIKGYLKGHHPAVYEILEDLGMSSSLRPKRGQKGFTFLLPDAKYTKKIRSTLDGKSPEDAANMIFSLCIPLLLQTPEDWEKMKDDIPNLLDKKIVVKEIKSGKVVIDNGTLTLDTKFVPFSRMGNAERGNMAVWNLSGEVEYEKAPKTTKKYVYGIPVKKGGNEKSVMSSNVGAFIRACIRGELRALEEAKDEQFISHIMKVMNNVVMRLKEWNDAECLRKLHAVSCGLHYVSFFILFGSRGDRGLFSLEILDKLIKSGLDGGYGPQRTQWLAFVNGTEYGLVNASAANQARGNLKDNLLNSLNRFTPSKIVEIYTTLESTNQIDGVALYSADVAARFAAVPGLKLCLDEFAYKLIIGFNNYFSNIPKDNKPLLINEFKSYIMFIGDMLGRDYCIIPGRSDIQKMAEENKTSNLPRQDISQLEEFIGRGFIFLSGRAMECPVVGASEFEPTVEQTAESSSQMFSDEECLTPDVIGTIQRLLREKGAEGLSSYLEKCSENE